jgi:hypothetical protein
LALNSPVVPTLTADRVDEEGNHSGYDGGGEKDVQGNEHWKRLRTF